MAANDRLVPDPISASSNSKPAGRSIRARCGSPDTILRIGSPRLSMMPGKKSGIVCGNHIVNCARGGIIDEDALLSALENGTISSAALDVFEVEPLPENYQLIRHENFHGTPHIGAATLEAQNRVGLDIAENVNAALTGKKPATVVNSQYLN